MLNDKDCAIVRAALLFLDEEFSGGDEKLLQHYLDDRGVLAGAGTTDIAATRAKFDQAQAFFATKHLDRDELVSTRLVPLASGDEATYQSDRELPVLVLVIGN